MKQKRNRMPLGQISLFDESALLGKLAEQQARLVFETLARSTKTQQVEQENDRLLEEIASNLDRLQEVHHRVRNHLQVLSGLMSVEEIKEQSPTARQALRKSIIRLTSIAAIHDLLARDPGSGGLGLPELAARLASHLIIQAGLADRIKIYLNVQPLNLESKPATAFILILTELLSNTIEHAFPNGRKGEIRLDVRQDGENAVLELRDNGCGLPAEFDLRRIQTLGLKLVTRLAERDLGGSLTARDENGACFRLVLPLNKLEAST